MGIGGYGRGLDGFRSRQSRKLQQQAADGGYFGAPDRMRDAVSRWRRAGRM